MAFLTIQSKAEILKEFTHYGWFGLCPVYLGGVETDDPKVAERNGIPEWWFDFNELIFQALNASIQAFKPEHEPVYMIRVGCEIEAA